MKKPKIGEYWVRKYTNHEEQIVKVTGSSWITFGDIDCTIYFRFIFQPEGSFIDFSREKLDIFLNNFRYMKPKEYPAKLRKILDEEMIKDIIE
jgi:hypothetical protein